MTEEIQKTLNELQEKARQSSVSEMLAHLSGQFRGEVTFSTSFSFEDQAITHEIVSGKFPISIFTLDTGRLFAETYSVWNSTIDRYKTAIHAYYPNHTKLESFVVEKGPNSFYESVDNRKACCFIRKVEPLQRALAGAKVWVTGLRAEHSANRQEMPQVEWDAVHEVYKFHPLLQWTTEEVKQFIQLHNIPYNILHDRGFVSIGCAPCTRAVKPGEDFRAGRWWWEDSSKKECGLHSVATDHLQKA